MKPVSSLSLSSQALFILSNSILVRILLGVDSTCYTVIGIRSLVILSGVYSANLIFLQKTNLVLHVLDLLMSSGSPLSRSIAFPVAAELSY